MPLLALMTDLATIGTGFSRRGLRAFGTPLTMAWLIVACAGLFSAGVLSLGHVLRLPVPCGGSQDCAAVAMHPASRLQGVPIAYFGVAAYAVMLWSISHASRRWARCTSVVITGVGAVISGALLYFSHAVIGAGCAWCLASGVAMGLSLVLSVAVWRRGIATAVPRPLVVCSFAMLTSSGLGVQAGVMKVAALAPPIPAERLQSVTADRLIDPAKSLGPADAAITVVIFSDLLCPGCRAAHAPLVRFQEQNPTAVRLAYRHLPLYGLRGHQFSGTAAALSEIAAEKNEFWHFVEAVYRQSGSVNGLGLLALLVELGFDGEQVQERLDQPDEPAYGRVLEDVELAGELGVMATPTFVLIIGNQPPISANQRTLPMILSSAAVQSRLAATGPPGPPPPSQAARRG